MASSVEALRALGQMIRARRTAAALTQSALGRKAGIVGKYVSEIERGTRDVPFSTLRAVAHGLGTRLEIRFESDAPTRESAALPTAVESLARAIAALPAPQRKVVLAITRSVLELCS